MASEAPDPVSAFRTPRTARVRSRPCHVVLLDNYDSFTYNIVHFLSLLGARVTVHPNTLPSAASLLDARPDGLLISPGPATPERSGITLEAIRGLAGRLPIFGVCLGMQALAVALGGSLGRSANPLHGRRCDVLHEGRGVLRGLPSPVSMARYNSLRVEESDLPPSLEITARSTNGEILGLRDQKGGLEGVQFHPESVLSECGLVLFDNWLEEL